MDWVPTKEEPPRSILHLANLGQDDVMIGPADDWSRVWSGRLVPPDFHYRRDQSSRPNEGPIVLFFCETIGPARFLFSAGPIVPQKNRTIGPAFGQDDWSHRKWKFKLKFAMKSANPQNYTPSDNSHVTYCITYSMAFEGWMVMRAWSEGDSKGV